MSEAPILSVRDLHTHFISEDRVLRAVDGVSFDLAPGETLGIVGESGSGKSVTALSMLRLIPWPPGRIVGGSVRLGDREVLSLDEREIRRIRGREIAMIFQEPRTAMNPVFRIGEQMTGVLRLHNRIGQHDAMARAREMLVCVHIAEPDRVLSAYPHELSGGMLQRTMIATALALRPRVLIADEPTTALDVTIQAQILRLLRELQQDHDLAILFITHDLGVVAQLCDRVMVMYAGAVVETAGVVDIFERPSHPYTRGLIGAVPRLTGDIDALRMIPGDVPDLSRLPNGCRFRDRCAFARQKCADVLPTLNEIEPRRWVRCHFPLDGG